MSRLSDWRRDGSPWHLAQPLVDLTSVLRRYGYVVGTLGDIHHLGDPTPEDHTPFSGSGWPLPNPYPWVHAVDVMPPPAGKGLPTLARLGAQLYKDRLADVPGIGWLKYMNWTPAGSGCVHDQWKPSHVRLPSGDVGHIHLSARTDWTHRHAEYDPVARLRGTQKVPPAAPASSGPAVPPFSRQLRYTRGAPMMRGNDVRTWQARMRARGWRLDVDGVYGPASDGVCRAFQRQKHLVVDGIVGPRTWNAAWTAPLT